MHIAFFRNLNQGQRGHPRTADLIAAFAAAGVGDAVPVRSNGTVVFDADDPVGVLADVAAELGVRGLFDDVILTRPLAFVEEVVGRYGALADAGRWELTLFDAAGSPADEAAVDAQARRRRCEVVARGPGWAVVRNDADRQSNGTPALEAVLGVPATSRGLPTLTRIVERFGP
ncbi:DUF1697 domain-containing protein [Microbacterium thalassium]|uniref:Uncharacterized protein (DUF1697 family) n=1 Tax=Microbacterium thalassium TaxID=362649 RepID=A0A7X0FMD5_9MICO|nr:DUF1697 domain-containing protein [Microbacterium thalassium]MBB6390144.1 uncharacterized protein (DUF1697 family) [Microbacterium thalassium]GLK25252.1 hypothetical protein GCM10017607_25710 [Microbacterium thalassium]